MVQRNGRSERRQRRTIKILDDSARRFAQVKRFDVRFRFTFPSWVHAKVAKVIQVFEGPTELACSRGLQHRRRRNSPSSDPNPNWQDRIGTARHSQTHGQCCEFRGRLSHDLEAVQPVRIHHRVHGGRASYRHIYLSLKRLRPTANASLHAHLL